MVKGRHKIKQGQGKWPGLGSRRSENVVMTNTPFWSPQHVPGIMWGGGAHIEIISFNPLKNGVDSSWFSPFLR